MVKFVVSSDVDSSDDELDGPVEQTPLAVDWVKVDDEHRVGISSLPGCICSGQRRSLRCDVDRMRALGIEESFVLCPLGELRAFKVRNLLWELDELDINVHHTPVNPAEDLSVEACLKILDELEKTVMSGKSTSIHCLCGYGRSSVLVALLIMRRNRQLSAEAAIDVVRSYHGPGAICTVRQYHFVKEFRQRVREAAEANADKASAAAAACVSASPAPSSLAAASRTSSC